MNKIIFFILLIIYMLVFSFTAFSLEINEIPTDFKYYGNAEATDSGRGGVLTYEGGGQSGAFWYQKKVDLRKRFIYEYEINLGNKGYEQVSNDDDGFDDGYKDIGADGIAFVFQRAGNDILGSTGRDVGYGGIRPSFAVEFDTYNNNGYYKNGDLSYPIGELDENNIPKNISYDHMAFLNNGYAFHTYVSSDLRDKITSLGDIEDGNYHKVKFDWNPTTGVFNAYFDGVLKLSLTNKNFVDDYLGGDPLVYFGFTASTGSHINEQKIRSVELTATIPDMDFGDAPESYLTSLGNHSSTQDGPHHIIIDGIHLGSKITSEKDGNPSSTASSDAGDDGVIFPHLEGDSSQGYLIAGRKNKINIKASKSGYLSCWIDYDKSGTFTSSEKSTFNLSTGDNDLYIDVPQSAEEGKTFSRFRYSTSQGDIGNPTGVARDGEVEDYQIEIAKEKITFSKSVKDLGVLNSGVGDGFAERGEILQYTLTIENKGNYPVYKLNIKDDINQVKNKAGYGFFNGTIEELKIDIKSPQGDLIGSKPIQGDLIGGLTIDKIDPNSILEISFNTLMKAEYPLYTMPKEIAKNTAYLYWEGHRTISAYKDIPIKNVGSEDLSIIKEVSDANGNGIAEDGEILTYSVRVKNNSGIILDNVVVGDPLSSPFLNVNKIRTIRVNKSPYSGDLIEGINIGRIMPEEEKILDFDIVSTYPANYVMGDSILNKAFVKYDSFIKDSLEVAIPTVKVDISNLDIMKSVSDTNSDQIADKDEILTYTISVSNNSMVDIDGASVSDILDSKFFVGQNPTNITVDGIPSKENIKNGISLPVIQPGKSIDISFNMVAAYPEGTLPGEMIENTASLSYNGSSINSEKVSIPVVTPDINKELTILKKVSDANSNKIADKDEILTYTISVANNSMVDIEGASVSDILDSKFFAGQNPTNITVDGIPSKENIKNGISLPVIQPGKSIDISFNMVAAYPEGTLPGEMIENTASLSYNGSSINSEKVSIPVVTPDINKELTILKKVSDANDNKIADKDEILTYTISVANNSMVDIEGASVSDILDSKFFAGQNPTNITVDGIPSKENIKNGISLPVIQPGKSMDISFNMVASYPEGTTSGDRVENTAGLSYGGKSIDSNMVSLPVEELSLIDLDIRLDVEDLGGETFKRGDGVVEEGESAEYTISVTNKSSVDAENVRVVNPYEEIFLYKDNSYNYLALENLNVSTTDLGEGIVISRIKAGETVKLKFQVEFSYSGWEVYEGDTIPNQAYLSFDKTPESKSLLNISSFAATSTQRKDSNIVVLNVADPSYTLTKKIRNMKETFYPGDTVIYDIQLTNNSTVIGRDVKIQDRVSQIKAFDSWNWTKGEVKDTDDLLKTGLRRDLLETGLTINPGESKNYTLVGNLKDDLEKGDVTNIAEAGKNLEIRAEAKLKVEEADIKIQKTAKKRWVSIGDLVSYKIVIQNLSASEGSVLRDIEVVDILPPGFKYAEDSAKIQGKKIQVENKGRTLSFKGITLYGKKEVEINYILRVGTGVKPGTYINKAWAENSVSKKVSLVAEAKVEVINDPLFNSTVIIGKVFHDRDGDGWQDDATARKIQIKTLTMLDNYSDGFMEKEGERWTLPQDSGDISLGDLTGKISEDSAPKTILLKRSITDPKTPGDIMVSTKEGTTITLKENGEVIKSYDGKVKKGLSGEVIGVTRRIVKDPDYKEAFKDVKEKKRVILNNIFAPVYFDSAYALIREDESEKLKKYIEDLQQKKNLKIILTGYTDSQNLTTRAKKRYRDNQDLSLARAEALKEYLAAKLDITEDMFVVEGRGSGDPVASNQTVSGRELNRRAEISIEYDEETIQKRPYRIDDSSYLEIIEIRNDGIIEEGIPGVRLATVEGLVMETDRFGRFHVDGVDDIPQTGKNYIIKVDSATLPPETIFTTENPRVKTLSKVMEKFNFGVKMPEMKKITREETVEVRVGSIFFKTNGWEIRKDQMENLKKIAVLLKKHNGGTIIIEGNTDNRASNEYNRVLALKRARAVEEQLTLLMGEEEISRVTVISQLPGGEV